MGRIGAGITKIEGRKLSVHEASILAELRESLLRLNGNFDLGTKIDPNLQLLTLIGYLNDQLIPNGLFTLPEEFMFPFSGLEGRATNVVFSSFHDDGSRNSVSYTVSQHKNGEPEFRIHLLHSKAYRCMIEVSIDKLYLSGETENTWSFGCTWGDEGICISDNLQDKPMSL